jgi:hypothetical protein
MRADSKVDIAVEIFCDVTSGRLVEEVQKEMIDAPSVHTYFIAAVVRSNVNDKGPSFLHYR